MNEHEDGRRKPDSCPRKQVQRQAFDSLSHVACAWYAVSELAGSKRKEMRMKTKTDVKAGPLHSI
jgi:hypothetical protein